MPEKETKSRAAKLLEQDSGLELSLPQCEAEFLVLLFYELGLCEQGMNGATPITWKEIQSWNEIADKRLTPWEANILKEMSNAYVNEIHAATDARRLSPYIEDIKRDAVKQEQAMENFFEMMLFQQDSKSLIEE